MLLEALSLHCRESSPEQASGGLVDISTLDLEPVQLGAAAAELAAREALLETKLQQLRQASRASAAAELPEMHARSAQLTATEQELNALSADLAASTELASASSSVLRSSHAERERAMRARKTMDDLLGLEECVGEVRAAIDRGDFAAAAARVAPLASAIEASEASDTSLGVARPTESKRAKEVVDALRERVRAELQHAASGRDLAVLCALVRLTGPLHCASEGCQALQQFSLRMLDEAAAEPTTAEPGSSAANGASAASNALGRLLQRCAALLEAASTALDERMGGGDATSNLAVALREHCVALGTNLGTKFNAACALRTMTEVRQPPLLEDNSRARVRAARAQHISRRAHSA